MIEKLKNDVPGGTNNTDFRYPERIGSGNYFIPFAKPKQHSKMWAQ